MNEFEEVLEARAMSLVENHEALLHDLVALRKKHGLTQEVVAERMGISQPAVAKFERYDANPRLSTLRRYAMAVGARLCDAVIDDHALESPKWEWVTKASPTVEQGTATEVSATHADMVWGGPWISTSAHPRQGLMRKVDA